MIPIEHCLLIGAVLFCIGRAIVITKKNIVTVLIGIELILNAANLNLVVFSQFDAVKLQGQIFALFIIIIATAEAAVALAITFKVYRHFRTIDLDKMNELKG